MSFSFSSLIRLIAFLSLGATMFAVGVSRVDGPSPDRRTRQWPGKININEYYLKDSGRSPRWLDVESGRIEPMPLVAGDVLESASCSPWVDGKNRGQVAGRWSARSSSGPKSTTIDFGLARYSYPGGERLDRVSTDVMPVSPPAWYPGTRARILFASGDGRLYHYAFERDRGPGGEADPGGDSRPRPLTWRCPPPGVGQVYLSDAQWSDDPRTAGILVATLRRRVRDRRGVLSFSRNELWWLKVDEAGTGIVGAGRLVAGEPDEGHDERSFAIVTLPDGRLVASYLRQQADARNLQVRVAPVGIDPDRGTPEIAWATTRVLAEDCQPAPLAFSRDGRFLAAVVGEDVVRSRPTRISTDPILFPDRGPWLAGATSPGR